MAPTRASSPAGGTAAADELPGPVPETATGDGRTSAANGWEYNFILAIVAVGVAVAGGGALSLDHAIGLGVVPGGPGFVRAYCVGADCRSAGGGAWAGVVCPVRAGSVPVVSR
jgi:hypothetical protein